MLHLKSCLWVKRKHTFYLFAFFFNWLLVNCCYVSSAKPLPHLLSFNVCIPPYCTSPPRCLCSHTRQAGVINISFCPEKLLVTAIYTKLQLSVTKMNKNKSEIDSQWTRKTAATAETRKADWEELREGRPWHLWPKAWQTQDKVYGLWLAIAIGYYRAMWLQIRN